MKPSTTKIPDLAVLETIHNPFRARYYPSTMEHSPLIAEEKRELIKYFSEDGSGQLHELSHWEHADTATLQNIEAWTWGLRFWGRECMIRAGAACLRLQVSLWLQALSKSAGNEVLTEMARGKMPRPEEQVALALNWADRPGEASLRNILAVQQPVPEAWMAPDFVAVQGNVFLWSVLAGADLLEAIFLIRDDAAMAVGRGAVGALRSCMLAGQSPEQATETVKGQVSHALRKWMGWRYLR